MTKLLCRLFGHADGVPFLSQPNRLAVRCAECGRVSDGVYVEPRKPKAEVVSIYQWRHEHEAERRTA